MWELQNPLEVSPKLDRRQGQFGAWTTQRGHRLVVELPGRLLLDLREAGKNAEAPAGCDRRGLDRDLSSPWSRKLMGAHKFSSFKFSP